jgi:hypothetical protein
MRASQSEYPMRTVTDLGIVGVVTIALTALVCGTALAQNNRSFVSGQGSDSNACTLSAPCRTFAQAITQTNAGGEITVLDSAGYGPVEIFKAISIVNPGGVEAGITQTAQNQAAVGIYATGTVALRGLTLEGGGAAYDGIQYNGQGRLEVIDCVIRNFTHDGVDIALSGSAPVTETVFISNTISQDNGSSGIELTGVFTLRGVIDHVATNHNGQFGITVDGTQELSGGFMDVAISGSIADSNLSSGVNVQGVSDVKVEMKSSVLSNNGSFGLAVSNAKVGISRNSLVLNGAAFSNTNSGTLTSFSDNVIENNHSANTGSSTPVGLQ